MEVGRPIDAQTRPLLPPPPGIIAQPIAVIELRGPLPPGAAAAAGSWAESLASAAVSAAASASALAPPVPPASRLRSPMRRLRPQRCQRALQSLLHKLRDSLIC